MRAASPATNTGRTVTAVDPSQSSAAPRQGLLLTACCLAQFMVILDIAIVNVALPSIQRSLGFAAADLQWVVNAYAITFAGFLMLSGRAADLFGRRRTFVGGLLLFSLASLIGGTAADQQVLIGARALQGLGAAIMAAASLAIITSSFAAGPERNRAIGLWGAMNGAGGATGTLLGGIITQELSWRWILLINLPIGIAVALVARVVVFDGHRERRAGGFDLAGALLVTSGLLALVYGIVSAGSHSWGSLDALGPIGLGAVLLVAFLIVESRFAAAPLVPLKVFNNRLLRVSNIAVLLLSATLFPMWYFASLYLQDVLHLGPLDAGLAFLPMSLTILACAMHAGRLVMRFGVGRVLGFGLSLMAAGMALFSRIAVGGDYISDFMLPSLLVSTGIGLSIVPSTIAATATAAPGEAGLASGLVNTSRQMGGALGLAVLTSVAVLYTHHLASADYLAPILALNDGFRLAFLLGAGLAAAGALVAFRFIPRTVRPAGPQPAPAAGTGAAVKPSRPALVALQGASTSRARSGSSPSVHVLAMPVAPAVVKDPPPQTGSQSPRAGADLATPSGPRVRPPRKPVARVVLSATGAGSWPLARGSMTVSTVTDEADGRAP
jgi:EmrB/QacA subfamily drug resistance transporter